MNIFKYWKNLYNWKNPLNWWRLPRYWCRAIKYGLQRATRGFSDKDTWDLDQYYTQLFIDSLSYFKEHLHSCPADLYDEETDSDEKWQKYLEHMIYYFYNSLEENKAFPSNFENERVASAWRRGQLEKGLNMFVNRFSDLWD